MHRLTVFGSPRLFTSSGESELTGGVGAKPLAMLTYLALAPNQSAAREVLTRLLWGTSPSGRAAGSCRVALSHLRRVLGPDQLSSHNQDIIALTAPIETDCDQLIAAASSGDNERVVDLYTDEFLANFAVPGAPDFDRWVEELRGYYRSKFRLSAQALVDQYRRQGHMKRAVAISRRLRDADPFSQESRCLYLQCLLDAGDKIGALDEALHLEQWLEAEELAPEHETAALLRRVRRNAAEPTSLPGPAPLRAELIGREREFSLLLDLAAAASSGGVRHASVVAPAGFGKSRLLEDYVTSLRGRRAPTIHIRAYPGEKSIPYATMARLVEALAKRRGKFGADPGSIGVLRLLHPALIDGMPNPPEAHQATGEDVHRLRMLALRDLVGAVSEDHPLVVVLDDLHWADPQSREGILSAFESSETSKALLVSASRVDLPDHGQAKVRLGPLDAAQIHALVSSLGSLPTAAWVTRLIDRLVANTRGIPLAILSSLQLAVDRGSLQCLESEWTCTDPDDAFDYLTSADSLRARLESLVETEAYAVLTTLALAGLPLSAEIIARTVEAPLAQSASALERLEIAGLASASRGLWSLAHDEAIVASLALYPVHDQLRRRLAVAMAAERSTDLQRVAARQFIDLGDYTSAATVLAPMLETHVASAGTLDQRIAAVLGDYDSPHRIAELKKYLPTRLRRSRGVRIAATVGVLGAVGLLYGVMAGADKRDPGSIRLHIIPVATNPGPAGYADVRPTPWAVDQPIVAGTRRRSWDGLPSTIGWRLVPRPHRRHWAVQLDGVDSGGVDIGLLHEGGRITRLTNEPGEDIPGSWSPDGRRLVIETARWSLQRNLQLALLDVESGVVTQLTDGRTRAFHPRWSPDGSRILFGRRVTGQSRDQVCWITIDRQRERCHELEAGSLQGVISWVSPSSALASVDSAGTMRTYLVDVNSWTFSALPTAVGTLCTNDRDWRWILCSSDASASIASTDQLDRWRTIALPNSRIGEWRLAVDGVAESKWTLDSLSVISETDTLFVGVPHQLIVQRYAAGGSIVEYGELVWRSLDTAIATVDSNGVLTPRRRGSLDVEVSAGGWVRSQRRFAVRAVEVNAVLDERWQGDPRTRWRFFGDPTPSITRGNGELAFRNNGDGNFFSGAYWRHFLDPARGIGVEALVSTPITAEQWQVSQVLLVAVSDTAALSKWDGRVGYVGTHLDASASCTVQYPNGEGANATKRINAGPGTLPIDPSSGRPILADGRWHTVRLQLFPDGRCGLAVNGSPIGVSPNNQRLGKQYVLILQGHSVGSDVLVRSVRAWTGVATDIDWRRTNPPSEIPSRVAGSVR